MYNNIKIYGADERILGEAKKYPGLELARVASQYKDIYKIISERGEIYAEVSGKFRYEAKGLSFFPAVGDFVMVSDDDKNSNALIHHVLSRKSAFERAAVGEKKQTQVIAANIDYVFICMSLNANYNLSRLERYLAVAYSSGAIPVVVLTKADLCDTAQKLADEVSLASPGTDVIITSADNPLSYEKLSAYLKPGVTASFVGSSGVGKSTLINRLCNEEALKTGDIRSDGKGRHTTTNRELILLKGGALVIDTPGMRELGAESVDLADTFSDIEALSEACRFSDCTHTNEPGCAVKEALQEGRLEERRFESYLKLKREARYEGLNFKKREEEKLNEMFKEVGGMKNIRKYNRKNDKRRGR